MITPTPARMPAGAAFTVVAATLVALLAAASARSADVPADLLLSARRIAVLGDSVTHDGRWVADLVAWMERRGTSAEVIDVALPSETVSGLSEDGHAGGKFPRPDLAERLDRVLRLVRPDVVLACYGMNCGIYQPLDDERFAKFKAGIERLHAAVEKAGATIVHLTPPVYDARPDARGPAGAADYDAVLEAYSTWLVSKRADGWLVIDVHAAMKRMLGEAREKDAAVVFAPDTVHPNDAGHWAICRAVLAGLGAGQAAAAETPAAFAAYLPEVTERLKLLRDAYLAAAGHLRPGMPPGVAVADAEARAREISASIRSRRLELAGRKDARGVWQMPYRWPTPPSVDPGPAPPAAAPIPADAVVLFDGHDLDAWQNAASWKVVDGVATIGKGSIQTKQAFGDCQVHLEYRMPAPPRGSGQGRGNSGLFFMGLYEIQLLDSFPDGTAATVTTPEGQCGALYKLQPPAVNACRAPGEWQTLDVLFTRPRFRPDGRVDAPGRVSVLHNGVAIHLDTVIKGKKPWFEPPVYQPHDDALPISIQDHGNPVQFRSIWVRPFVPLQPDLIEPLE